jgi:hypothetical protein
VQLGHDSGPFADRTTDALDRAGAYIAHGKNTGNIASQGGRLRGGVVRPAILASYVRARLNEPFGVKGDAALQPARRRLVADKQEEVTQRLFGFLARGTVTPANAVELALRRARQSYDLGETVWTWPLGRAGCEHRLDGAGLVRLVPHTEETGAKLPAALQTGRPRNSQTSPVSS